MAKFKKFKMDETPGASARHSLGLRRAIASLLQTMYSRKLGSHVASYVTNSGGEFDLDFKIFVAFFQHLLSERVVKSLFPAAL